MAFLLLKMAMKIQSIRQNPTRTKFIQLDTRKCIACWKCQSECRNQVIGRVDLPWHKHSRFVNSTKCTGCFKCLNVCAPGALVKISNNEQGRNDSKKKNIISLMTNLGLLLFGFLMAFSGFLIQIRYHMGHNHEMHNSTLDNDFCFWADTHKISSMFFSFLVIYHFIIHLKWYKTVFIKKTAGKNKLQLLLVFVFILVAISGYIPWILDLTGRSELIRKFFIEIHDKITILLFFLIIVHFIKKFRYYITSFKKIRIDE